MAKAKAKRTVEIFVGDPNSTPSKALAKIQDAAMPSGSPLVKRIMDAMGNVEKSTRLSFEEDPTQFRDYQSIYYMKNRMLPDALLKRVAVQDSLVAAILVARGNHLSVFGQPQGDRFSYGYKFEFRRGMLSKLSEEKKKEIHERIDKCSKRLVTCGDPEADGTTQSLKEFLYVSTQNGLKFGRFATEILYKENALDTDEEGKPKKEFHAFRYIDAGSIYRATRHTDSQARVRKQARKLLEDLKGDKAKLDPERFEAGEYAWIQVFENRPIQAFTAEECVVTNFYPCSDYELQGYPLTPIDSAISDITTHINITSHNKLYFQSGRAARGMLVIKSADVDEAAIARIRAQFQASINGVGNSWRLPVFAISPEDEVSFQSIDSTARDSEFQYLSDSNARVIMAAFMISPEEIPGYGHLSRGTNNQSLSEANNEYKLEAARDVGIRPIIAHIEAFLNDSIVPLMDGEVAKYCYLRLLGLEATTPEKESVRFQQDMPIWMCLDEVLEKVEKPGLGKRWGGKFPLNPAWAAILDKYVYVGEIREFFFDVPDGSKDPLFHYVRDPFYFQAQSLELQKQQMQAQAQAQQMQAQQPQGGGQQQPQGQSPQDADTQGNGKDKPKGTPGEQPVKPEEGDDLSRALDQAIGELGGLDKSERQLPTSKARVLAKQRVAVRSIMNAWEADKMATMDAILDVAIGHAPARAR